MYEVRNICTALLYTILSANTCVYVRLYYCTLCCFMVLPLKWTYTSLHLYDSIAVDEKLPRLNPPPHPPVAVRHYNVLVSGKPATAATEACSRNLPGGSHSHKARSRWRRSLWHWLRGKVHINQCERVQPDFHTFTVNWKCSHFFSCPPPPPPLLNPPPLTISALFRAK